LVLLDVDTVSGKSSEAAAKGASKSLSKIEVLEKRCTELQLQKLEMMKSNIVAYNERKKKVAKAISVKEMTYLAERSMEKKFSLMENKEPRGMSRRDVRARWCFLS
jgi:hypothetical protein